MALRKANIETELFPPHLMAEIEELNHSFIRAQGESHGRTKLVDGNEIYDQVIQLMRKAKESIAVLTYSQRPPAPMSFAEAIRDHLLKHAGLSFEVIIAADLVEAGPQLWRDTDARFQVYDTSGLRNRVCRWVLDTNVPTGFDVGIIDQKHVLLAFSPFPVSKQDEKQLALLFDNAGDLARGLYRWFQAVKVASKPYDECRALHSEAPISAGQKQ